MTNPDPRPGPQGGFAKPEFTLPGGPAPQRGGPAVSQHLAAAHGSAADVVEEGEERDVQRRRANRERRGKILLAAATALAAILVIVALMVWLWSTDVFVT
ncbi:hypothetical protein [Corynebacterium halotolerans]|uniref:hypothetical protein n=1 Tax=Corynebacterium halotolerans TaxID=225326 RepID=UPI003CF970A7